jgi:hypothetical protein
MVAKMPTREINDNDQAPEKKGLRPPRRGWQTPKVVSIDVTSTKFGRHAVPDDAPFSS